MHEAVFVNAYEFCRSKLLPPAQHRSWISTGYGTDAGSAVPGSMAKAYFAGFATFGAGIAVGLTNLGSG